MSGNVNSSGEAAAKGKIEEGDFDFDLSKARKVSELNHGMRSRGEGRMPATNKGRSPGGQLMWRRSMRMLDGQGATNKA